MNINTANPNPAPEWCSTPMRFQERDGKILQAIYRNDGVMARRQLLELFWPGRSARALEKRIAKLRHMGYITWPERLQRRTRPIPEPIIWLNWKGIGWIAGQSGIHVEPPKTVNENQLRIMESRLREKGIHWIREPRWAQLEHDLAVVDFRLCVEKAVKQNPTLSLEEWVNESAFRARPDVVEFDRKTNGSLKRVHKRVIPDGYFAVVKKKAVNHGAAARARFLLEVDLATHDNPSFGSEKVLPGVAYILSSAYQHRFGSNTGRWLVVTTGERRLRNLKRQAETSVGSAASTFFFTTLDQIRPETILSAPIWQRGRDSDRHEIFESTDCQG